MKPGHNWLGFIGLCQQPSAARLQIWPNRRRKPSAESASGSIGLRGGSYCRRLSSARGGSGQQIANLAERKCKSGRTLMQICEDRNTPAPRNSFTDRSMAYYPRRCDHFPYTSPSDHRSGHLQGASGAQVNCTKVRRVRYSLPADKKHLTQRAASCENGWSVRESGLPDFR